MEDREDLFSHHKFPSSSVPLLHLISSPVPLLHLITSSLITSSPLTPHHQFPSYTSSPVPSYTSSPVPLLHLIASSPLTPHHQFPSYTSSPVPLLHLITSSPLTPHHQFYFMYVYIRCHHCFMHIMSHITPASPN